MHLLPSRPARAAILLGAAVTIGGCRGYSRQPLDLDAHRLAWHGRLPADEPVRAFAQRLAATGDARAATFDPEDGLTLAEGELVALVYNPDLRLDRLGAGVARATSDHGGRWDDPEAAIDVLRITESVPDPWIVAQGLSITIPISGRLGAEKARAEAALHAELERVAETEWKVRHEVQRAWLAWSAARMRVQRTQELIASMDALVDSTARLTEAGEMVRTESALFAIEQVQQRYELERLEGEAQAQQLQLRAVMGLSPDAPLELVSTLDPGAMAIEPDLDTAAARNPTLARLRGEYEVAERALDREVRRQYPDLTIGPVYESDEGQSRIGFAGGIPVPIFNANRQAIAEAEAQRELARAAFETEYERLAGSLAAAQARARALGVQRGRMTDELAPMVDRQLEDAGRLLTLGEGGGLVLLESLARSHRAKLDLIEVRAAEAMAHAEIAHLVGPPGGQAGSEDAR